MHGHCETIGLNEVSFVVFYTTKVTRVWKARLLKKRQMNAIRFAKCAGYT